MRAWWPLMATSLKPSGRRRSPLATPVAPQRPPERFLPLREAPRDLERECRAEILPPSSPGVPCVEFGPQTGGFAWKRWRGILLSSMCQSVFERFLIDNRCESSSRSCLFLERGPIRNSWE